MMIIVVNQMMKIFGISKDMTATFVPGVEVQKIQG